MIKLKDNVDWDSEDIKFFVKTGAIVKKKRVEHLALNPAFLSEPITGILDELNKSLGTYMKRLDGYMVAYEKVSVNTNIGIIHYDHPWSHLDFSATFYVFKPIVGQHLSGIIKKISKPGSAANLKLLCPNFFVTVHAQSPEELANWNVNDRLDFEVVSFEERRKGPIIIGKGVSSYSQFNEIEEMDYIDEPLPTEIEVKEDHEESSKKKKKKKKSKED